MKIIVFAYNRFETMTTPRLLEAEGIPHIVLCHSADDRQKFIDCGTAQEKNIVATGNPRGLQYERNAALEILYDGEWGLFLNDDLIEMRYLREYVYTGETTVPVNTKNTTAFSKKFNVHCPLKEFVQICESDCRRAEGQGVWLAGFANNSNPLFRATRWGDFGLVDGRAWLVRKSSLRFDTEPDAGVIEDHFWTAKNLVKYGKVQVDRWVEPRFKRMTAGGYGNIVERQDELRRACALLICKYPHLFAYKGKKGYPPYTQVRFKNIMK